MEANRGSDDAIVSSKRHDQKKRPQDVPLRPASQAADSPDPKGHMNLGTNQSRGGLWDRRASGHPAGLGTCRLPLESDVLDESAENPTMASDAKRLMHFHGRGSVQQMLWEDRWTMVTVSSMLTA